jgi:hypothetical protein
LGFEFLNLILALTNCLVVATIFLELAAVAELIELPETEDITVDKVARMAVAAGTVVL